MPASKSTGSVNQFNSADDIIQINLHQLIRNAVPNMMTGQTNKWFKTMAEVLESKVGTKTAFRATHKRLADDMQAAVLKSYDDRVEAAKEFPSYRIGDRLSGGVLRKVLAQSDQFVAFNDGISFGYKPRLDEAAAHWARLNFGAGSIAYQFYRPQVYTLHFGKSLGSIKIEGYTSRGFKMPKGVWDLAGSRGRGAGFYPTGSKLVKQTRGIGGAEYFDAALEFLASPDGLEAAYDDLLFQFVARAKRESQGPLKGRGFNIKDFYA